MFDALFDAWQSHRYRYGLIVPVLILTTGLVIWAALTNEWALAIFLAGSPFLAVVLTAGIVMFVTWLDGDID